MTDYGPYSDPKAYGLEIVGEVELADGWDYNKFVVWRDDYNNFFHANDSGCSCSSPFEGDNRASLRVAESAHEIQAALAEWRKDSWEPDWKKDDVDAQVFTLMEKLVMPR